MKQDNSLRQETRKQMMINDPIGRVIIKMSIPTIVAFLINSIYSLADTYFVSGLGTNATAAVSVNASLDQLIMMGGSMLAVGANSYIARLLGQGNDKKASQVLSTAFILAAAIGVLLLVFGNIFMTPMVRLLGATPTCEQYSVEYATFVLLAAPFMTTSFVMNQCLRSEGSATLSMIGMGFGGVLNCALDPIFIQGLPALGIPAMGVAGASLATAISKFVSFGILVYPYLTHRSLLHLSIRNFHCTWDIIGKVISVGSSSMFRNGLAVVAGIVLNDLAGNISDSVLAGIGVSTKVMMFPFSIILGFGTGFQPVAGFNWGAKRYDRVQQSFRFSSIVAIIGSLIIGSILIVLADPIIVAFAGEDPQMRSIGAFCIRLQCLALPVHGWVAVVNMLCAGLGNAFGAVLLSTARQGTCMLPIVHLLAYLLGEYGIASVQAVADFLTLTLAIPMALYMLKKIRRGQLEISTNMNKEEG
jgi:putative MATE family efflux protein